MFKRQIKRKLLAVTLGVTWLAAVAAGSFVMLRYANTPGKAGATPLNWPESSQLAHNKEKPTLILFMHPHCPCSRASMGELALLMAHCQGRVDAHVLFMQPATMASDWVETDTWRSAARIPGVTVGRDRDAREAQLFGVETSGDTVMFDPRGRLMFHGGITLARGHSGDNPGRDALEALLFGLAPETTNTPAFGCSLFECKTKMEP